jgi:hypothetical protein
MLVRSICVRMIWGLLATVTGAGLIGCSDDMNQQQQPPDPPKGCTADSVWTTVDDYQGPGTDTYSSTLVQDPAGVVYQTGGFLDGDKKGHWFVRKSSDGMTNWTLVDDFQRVAAKDSYVVGAIAPRNNAVLVVGDTYDEMDRRFATLRRTEDGGATWVSDFFQQEMDGVNTVYRDIGVDTAGSIYLMGGGASGGLFHWTVRKSVDGGKTHTPFDDYVHPDSDTNTARGIVDDASGKLYVIGSAQKAGNDRWITRSNVNGAFEVVDDYQYPGGTVTYGFSIARHPSGSLFGFGNGTDSAGKNHCLIRRRAAGETTWNLVDDFQLQTGQECFVSRAVVDPEGTLYVAESAQTPTSHGIIRRSTDGGTTWSTFADYEFTTGKDTYSYHLMRDPSGDLLWSLSGKDGQDQGHGIIRRLDCSP